MNRIPRDTSIALIFCAVLFGVRSEVTKTTDTDNTLLPYTCADILKEPCGGRHQKCDGSYSRSSKYADCKADAAKDIPVKAGKDDAGAGPKWRGGAGAPRPASSSGDAKSRSNFVDATSATSSAIPDTRQRLAAQTSRPGMGPLNARLCEWSPHDELRMSSECGFNDLGVPNLGVFSCGSRLDANNMCSSHCERPRCVPG